LEKQAEFFNTHFIYSLKNVEDVQRISIFESTARL